MPHETGLLKKRLSERRKNGKGYNMRHRKKESERPNRRKENVLIHCFLHSYVDKGYGEMVTSAKWELAKWDKATPEDRVKQEQQAETRIAKINKEREERRQRERAQERDGGVEPMTDEEKLYVLMAQAEDLQKHAVELQKEAQETFSALPLAVEQAVQKIRSERFSAAVYVFCFGALIAGGIYAGLNVYGSKLQEEHEKLKTAIQDEEATLTKLESKTLGAESV